MTAQKSFEAFISPFWLLCESLRVVIVKKIHNIDVLLTFESFLFVFDFQQNAMYIFFRWTNRRGKLDVTTGKNRVKLKSYSTETVCSKLTKGNDTMIPSATGRRVHRRCKALTVISQLQQAFQVVHARVCLFTWKPGTRTLISADTRQIVLVHGPSKLHLY